MIIIVTFTITVRYYYLEQLLGQIFALHKSRHPQIVTEPLNSASMNYASNNLTLLVMYKKKIVVMVKFTSF